MRGVRLIMALLFIGYILVAVALPAQHADPKAREEEWKGYALPAVEFSRYVDLSKVVLVRVPADWQRTSYLHFRASR